MNPGFLFAIGAAITWGLVYTIDQRVLSGVSPFALLFIDSVVTAVVMLPFVFLDEKPILAALTSGERTWELIVLSIILAAFANFLIFSAIKLIGAPSASIIEISYPFFVVLFSYVFLRAMPNLYFLIGGVLIFLGSAVIVYFH